MTDRTDPVLKQQDLPSDAEFPRLQDEQPPQGRDKRSELLYQRDLSIDPLKLIGNASLALHHHMAPADGSFDFGDEPDGD